MSGRITDPTVAVVATKVVLPMEHHLPEAALATSATLKVGAAAPLPPLLQVLVHLAVAHMTIEIPKDRVTSDITSCMNPYTAQIFRLCNEAALT